MDEDEIKRAAAALATKGKPRERDHGRWFVVLGETPQGKPVVRQITGRDAYIITKALCYAIALIDALPDRRKEESDREDMAKLVLAAGRNLDRQVMSAENHSGLRCDLGDSVRVPPVRSRIVWAPMELVRSVGDNRCIKNASGGLDYAG